MWGGANLGFFGALVDGRTDVWCSRFMVGVTKLLLVESNDERSFKKGIVNDFMLVTERTLTQFWFDQPALTIDTSGVKKPGVPPPAPKNVGMTCP
jgi:hypothetical protein